MIIYELRCTTGHGFEAWFRNSDAYDQQHAAQQITCPVCGDAGVSKAPMAPRIGRSDRALREAAREKSQEQTATGNARADQIDPEQLRMVMTKIAELNQHIADTCDYVGNTFAEEARKIHYGETEHREIYGETSPTEAAELREEGISIATVPWIRRSDS
ncbi:MAG: hypothetical protein JWM91_2998 [Rhodospirillales bacterium]|nr:hypothetical protein [Rhodospirillales bacterium]